MSDNSNKSSNAPITNLNKELEKRDDSNDLKPMSTFTRVLSSKPPETNASSSKGKQSSSILREIQIEDRNTEKSKEQQEQSLETASTENLEDFYMLLENISKSLNELETLIKFTSSSFNATTKSLPDINSFLNLSVGLSNDAALSRFRKATAVLLIDKASILGKNKCDLLKNFNVDLDREVNRFRTVVEKEKKIAELFKNRSKHVEALDTHKTALQPCRDEMQMMASKHEEMKKNIREYEMTMIQKMPLFQRVYSQQSSIDTVISSLQVNEQLLQQEDQEIDSLRRGPLIYWSGLVAAFYN